MLAGKRIKLRLIHDEADCRKVCEAYNDLSQRAGTDHTEIKHPNTLLKQFSIDGLWGEEGGTLLLTDLDDKLLGDISFNKCSELELEIGYRIFHKQNRGKGYVSEALVLFSAYLFETKPIRRLRIQTASDNMRSRRVAEKSGYREEGIVRKAYFYRGKVCDFVIFGLLREECPPFREVFFNASS